MYGKEIIIVARKYLDLQGLECYHERLMRYINMQIDLKVNKSTHCPNCGAVITSSKCEYCGTDFEMSSLFGSLTR